MKKDDRHSKDNQNNKNVDLNKNKSTKKVSHPALDDENRIKVLSPSMLVLKRFFRNRLAMIGLIIIIAMFLFSFLGPIISPYTETQQFMKVENEPKIYAGATYNENYYYLIREGYNFNSIAKATFILSLNNNQNNFSAKIDNDEIVYYIEKISEDTYYLFQEIKIASFVTVAGKTSYTPLSTSSLNEDFIEEADKIVKEGESGASFNYQNDEYYVFLSKRSSYIYKKIDTVLLSKDIFTPYDNNETISYDTALAAEIALSRNENNFSLNGVSYNFITKENKTVISKDTGNGEAINYADITNLLVTPIAESITISIAFRDEFDKALKAGASDFIYTDTNGNETTYTIERKDMEFVIRTIDAVDLLDVFAPPSIKHPVGTDGYGMDLLTRLMYGGRISLTIGFVVIFIEIFIGVIMGGISGYFTGWIDTVIMRIVDTINCIPNIPLYLILGSVMSTLKVSAALRIYLLMVILGVTGWTGIARVVRGQILSLREQEFMTAAEALGISTTRKIFQHLIPNVIPQLIVYATMGLGGIILTEATLSFLNLGVKYPYASWGNIVNAVNDSFVMTNYLFVWIPAGFLILITVLGFNFIGDGLRDAFDPKMKR